VGVHHAMKFKIVYAKAMVLFWSCKLLWLILSLLLVNKLTFYSICTVSGSSFVPLLAHLGFVVFMRIFITRVEFVVSVSICTVLIEFAITEIFPIFA